MGFAYLMQELPQERLTVAIGGLASAVAAIGQAGRQASEGLLVLRDSARLQQVRHNGLTGFVAFDQEGNLANPVFTIYQVRNQKWTPLKTIGGKK